MRGHTKSLDTNDKLIQTRSHERDTIASRKRQVVMQKVKSTILATNENIIQRVMFLDGTSLPENHQNYNVKRITNLGQPVEPDDAATKRFVGNILRKRTFYINPEGAQEN